MVALDLARGAALASTALVVGALLFLALSWRLRDERGGGLAARLLRLLAIAAMAGLAASVAALALEKDPSSLQTSAWIAGGAAFLVLAFGASDAPRRRGGADVSPVEVAVAAGACAALVLVPGLSGNAAQQTPAGLVVAANAGHVLSASAWAGGIACMLIASAWALAERDRLVPLSRAANRFSSVALVAVVGVALTGVLQGIALVGRVEALVTTGYGRLVMAKAALLCVLALAGALHRGRTLPDLDAAARADQGGAAALNALRRLLAAEAVLLTLVFGLTALLAGGRPPSSASETVRASAAFGPGRISVRASPGRPGANELTIELRGDTVQRPPRRLAVSARQPRLGIGPIALRARRAANARFVVAAAPLDAPGTWELTVSGADDARATVRLRLR